MAELAVVVSLVALFVVGFLALSFARLAGMVADLAGVVANIARGLSEVKGKLRERDRQGDEWDF